MSLKDSLRGAFTSVAADAGEAGLMAVQTRATGAFGLNPRLAAIALPAPAPAAVRVSVPNSSPVAADSPQDKQGLAPSFFQTYRRPLMLAAAVGLGLAILSRVFRRKGRR